VFELAGASGGPEALRDLTTAFTQAVRGFADALEATVVTGLEALEAAAPMDSPLPPS
jgi:ABC-type transporter Mla subunit MlaD